MQKCLTCLVCALVVSQVCAWDPLKIQNADSPDGKYVLEAVATSHDACRLDVKSKSDGKVVGQIAVKDYYPEDHRYSISAVWKEDSAGFALNIEEGRNITSCRVFVEHHGSWKEVGLPEKRIAKLRKEGNKEGGKEVDYLFASGWLPNDEIKLTYAGNKLVEFVLIAHLIRAGRPRLDFVKIVPRKVEPKPKYDYENYVFTVLAGGTKGTKDGTGSAAQFSAPCGLSIDGAGNVFVADRANHLIRKISRDGVVSTLAGSPGNYGDTDGTSDTASFREPVATAVDTSGNVYVAEAASSNLIRKITPHGMVSTLAGSSSESGGYADGTGSAAQFRLPFGVAVDNKGNVFVADKGNMIIRKITSDGNATTFAGSAGEQGKLDGEAKSARFAFPWDLALDHQGNLYVIDGWAVRKIDTHAIVSTLAGSPDQAGSSDGTGSDARFSGLSSVAVSPAGNVYVVDNELKNIRKITPAGVVKTIRDSTGRTPFGNPVSIAVDDNEQIYVVDEDGFRILIGKPVK